MKHTQMTVENSPADETMVGLCFRNAPSTDANARRFNTPRKYLGVSKRVRTMQTGLG